MAAKRIPGAPGAVPQIIKPAPQGASRTGETVVVGCKLPHGIIMRGFRRTTTQENVIGGGLRDVVKFEETGRRVTVYGNARMKGGSYKTRMVCGYALTQGIPKDLWDEWVESNKEMPAVALGLIFAEDSIESAAARAREGRAIRSGLEPMKARIEDDPRTPRPINPDVGELRMDSDKMRSDQFEQIDSDEEAA